MPKAENVEDAEALLQSLLKAYSSKKANVYRGHKSRSQESVGDETCPECHGRGGRTVVDSQTGQRVWISCVCREQRIIRLKAQNAGIPSEYLEVSLPLSDEIDAFAYLDITRDAIRQININKFLEQYVTDLDRHIRERRSVLMFGNNGSGKTSASVYIALNALRSGYSVKYITLRRFLNQKMNYSDPEALEEAERVRDVDVLVLDDIGKEFHSASSVRVLVEIEELLRHRFSRDGITILTSNFNPFSEEMMVTGSVEKVHQESILSLITAHCLCLAIIIREDYRRELGRRLWEGLNLERMGV